MQSFARRTIGWICAVALSACAQPLPAENPSDASLLYFPGPLLAMPGGHAAYVVSTNFDQRFDAGWLTRIDLDALAAQLQQGGSIASALKREIKVPSLVGDWVQVPGRARAYATHRGRGLVSAYDLAGAQGDTPRCGAAGSRNSYGGYIGRSDCDDDHLFDLKRLLAERDGILHKPEREKLDDPLAMVGVNDSRVLVAFLNDARVITLGDSDATKPSLQATRLAGAGRASYSSLTMLSDNSVLAAGRAQQQAFAADEAVLSKFAALPAADDLSPVAAVGQHMFVSRALSDGRANDRAPARLGKMIEGSDHRIYVLSRGPEAILVLAAQSETPSRSDAQGTLLGGASVDPCDIVEAYALPDARLTDALLTSHNGADMLVATSLERDALYFFDVSGPRLQLMARLRIDGRGPYRMLPVTVGSRSLLLVSTFYDHGLTVVDLSPTSASDFVATSFADGTNPSHLFRP